MKEERKFRTFISLVLSFFLLSRSTATAWSFHHCCDSKFISIICIPSTGKFRFKPFVLSGFLCFRILTGKMLVFGGGLAITGATCLLLFVAV
jgi:hypothetical protein